MIINYMGNYGEDTSDEKNAVKYDGYFKYDGTD
jgi:hypothetical protein